MALTGAALALLLLVPQGNALGYAVVPSPYQESAESWAVGSTGGGGGGAGPRHPRPGADRGRPPAAAAAGVAHRPPPAAGPGTGPAAAGLRCGPDARGPRCAGRWARTPRNPRGAGSAPP